MKILQVSQEYYPLISGPTNQAHTMARQLIRRGHEASVLTTTAGTDLEPGPDQIDDVPVFRVPVRGRIMRCYFATTLHRELDLTGIDVVNIHGWRNYVSEYVMHRARRQSIPIVLHAHGSAGMHDRIVSDKVKRLPYVAYDLMRRNAIVNGPDRLIVSTNQECQEAIAYGFDPARIAVIPPGFEPITPNPLKSSNRNDVGPLQLLFVGRLAADRNVEPSIRAVAQLRDRGRDVTLRIVGPEERRTSLDRPGYLKALRELVAELRVEDRVVFTGELRGAALAGEYACADLFVSTSQYENFGIAMLEAAGYGLPLITTPTGVGPDLVVATGAGAVVPFDDPAAIVSAIERATADPAVIDQWSATMKAHVAQVYSWDRLIDSYLDLLGEITVPTHTMAETIGQHGQ